MSAYSRIDIRDTATLHPSPLPEHYEFLKAPSPRLKYRINFRHPAYAPDDNLLFTLYAWDHADGRIHHGLAHCACSIFADNRIDGYLSRTCNSEHGDRIDASWDDVLRAADADYYFYVPYPSDFQDPVSNTAAQTNLTAAIHRRDITCRVTAFESGTEVAHLIPDHERQWFLSNSMAMWNNDLTLDPSNLQRDLSNAVLLRSDMHTAFDQRKFVLFPKGAEDFVVHMLGPTTDIGQLYRNTRICIPQCSLEFLYSRFAWAIFPSLSGFLSRPGRSRLVVRSKADTGERVTEEVTNSILLARRATTSGSTSPTKRSWAVAELDDCDDEYDHSKRHQTCWDFSPLLSFNSTLPTLNDDNVVRPKMRASQSPIGFDAREPPNISPKPCRVEKLRREHWNTKGREDTMHNNHRMIGVDQRRKS
ncbi:hypothetical protein IFR05_005276 [Cadophora sp. M221]|nr:hypothetical protein IFR05_005276 [Cadophora sp. M221]